MKSYLDGWYVDKGRAADLARFWARHGAKRVELKQDEFGLWLILFDAPVEMWGEGEHRPPINTEAMSPRGF